MNAEAINTGELVPVLREDLAGVLDAARDMRDALAVLIEKLDAVLPEPDGEPKPRMRGRKQPLALALPPDLIEQIDAVAEANDRRRAKTIERLIIAWLERRNGGCEAEA